MAYSALGTSYANLGEGRLAEDNIRKAYELRERVSERERFNIESLYHQLVTGDLEKGRQSYELWARTYPRDFVPRGNLAVIYSNLGQYDKALAAARELSNSAPEAAATMYLANAYQSLNRIEDAHTSIEKAQAKSHESPVLRFYLYQLAFLQNDVAGMAEQVAWSAGKPGVEDVLLAYEADTVAYSGHLKKARELSSNAVATAERADEKETAAAYEADAAIREALFGHASEARQRAAAALRLSTGRDVQYGVALALAFSGDATRAQALTDDLTKRFPQDTIVQFHYLPTIRAQIALGRNTAKKAVEVLQIVSPYELGATGSSAFSPALYPVYVRGQAFLAARQGNEAAVEFRKVLDHRGVIVNEPIGALAYLGLARAYRLQGDTANAKTWYRDFLSIWKDADPDIPILKQAKAEYAKPE